MVFLQLCVLWSPCLPSYFYDPSRIANTGHEVSNPSEENKLGHGPQTCPATHMPCTNKPLVIDLGRYLDKVNYKQFNKIDICK